LGFKNTDKVLERSCKIMDHNMKWLLYSDIRIKSGQDKGALYGWKDLSSRSFPFIYSEITGYAITFFSWIASEFRNPDALRAAKDSSDWIKKNLRSYLVVAKPPGSQNQANALSDVYYSFDNGMIIIGLLNLHKITKDNSILKLAEKMTQALIERFFDGEKIIPRIDNSHTPIMIEDVEGIIKWSTISGPYHTKLSIGLFEISQLTNNPRYLEVSNSICDYALKLQGSKGQFITNPGSDIVYLHPHLYACEGLIYSGLKQSNEDQYNAGLKGLRWAVDQLVASNFDALLGNTQEGSVEQSDCTAQLLRLLVLCRSSLTNFYTDSKLNNIIDRLHSRLLEFYIPAGSGQGAMRYQFSLDTACSWCTMFSAQALNLWKYKNSGPKWIDYFV
jgi:hypothetical protein